MIIDLFFPYYRNMVANLGGDNFEDIYNFEDCLNYLCPNGIPDDKTIFAVKEQIIRDVLQNDPKREFVKSGKYAGNISDE